METPAIPVNQKEPEEVPETMETPAIPANQSKTEEVPYNVEIPAIAATQSEPEEVPETMETLPFQVIREHQRRSLDRGDPCNSS